METIKLDDGTEITNIGTLEWNTSSRTILPVHLENIRPTTEKDTSYVKISAAQYALDATNIEGEYNKRIREALLYIAIHNLMTIHREYLWNGPILLVFAKKQLRWDITLQCNAYKVEA